jgi:hypothetical protein
MAKKETKKLEYFTDWKYAPSPEATDHIRLQKQYDLFINGKFENQILVNISIRLILQRRKNFEHCRGQ